MQYYCLTMCAGLFLAAAEQAEAQGAATPIWEVDGFSQPESVLSDPDRNVLYVSNIAGEPTEADGIGHVSRLSADGELQELEWVAGLDAPKGMSLVGSTLYVSDITRLVAIDVESGQISETWDAEGAVFLNDVAGDGEGRVYVSDMMTNRIYALENGVLSVWLEGDELMHPNGLKVDGDRLLIASWGQDIQPDFSTLAPGHLLSIEIGTKDISAFGSGEPIGNLDGIEREGDASWLATDWIAGALIRIMSDGSHEVLVDLNMGSADLAFLADEQVAVIPMMLDNKVVAHEIE